MKKKYLVGIGVVVLLLGIVLVLFLFWPKEKKEILYHLEYQNDYVPGAKYEISIYSNNDIKITKTSFCSKVDCEPEEPVVFDYHFHDKNMKLLKQFIEKHFPNQETINIPFESLNAYEKDVISSLEDGELAFEISVEEYEYQVIYEESPTTTYVVYLKEDDSILVKKITLNSKEEMTNIDSYSLNFKENHKKLLKEQVKQWVGEDSNVVYKTYFYKDEQYWIKSVQEKDEKYLEENRVHLVYEMSYHGINCLTPVLRLYDDSTYEFYDTFSNDQNPIIPETGTYDYDFTELFENIDQYPEDPLGPYSIYASSDERYYTTYSSNKELRDFLSSVGIRLDVCIHSQS